MIERTISKLIPLMRRALNDKALCMTFLALAFASPVRADEADPKNTNAVPGSIASNQPIAVEAEVAANLIPPPPTSTEQPPIQEPQPSPAVPELNEIAQEPAPTHAGSTLVRRARDVPQTVTQQVNDQRPWYRSTLFSLSVVLALIGAAYYGVRKLVPSLRAPQRSELIRVLARTALTPKQHVALVQCGRRVVLIGVSPDRVETLSEITDPTEVSELTISEAASERRPVAAGAFGKWFDKERDSYAESTDTTLDVALHESVPSPIRSNNKGTKPPLKELLERVRALGA